MNIRQATTLAMMTGLLMQRKNEDWHQDIGVEPTDTDDCCFLVVYDSMRRRTIRQRRWNPHADDLVATDWVLTKYLQDVPEDRFSDAERATGCGGISDDRNFESNGMRQTIGVKDAD